MKWEAFLLDGVEVKNKDQTVARGQRSFDQKESTTKLVSW